MRFKKLIATGAVALGLLSLAGVAGVAVAAGDGPAATYAESEKAEEPSSEGSGEADGPGGHEDPPGDVEHEFDGEE